jgi:hypothetical protein
LTGQPIPPNWTQTAKGKSVMRILSVTLLATLFSPITTFAQTDFEALAIQQLKCAEPPSPLPLLESLEALGKLNPATLDSMDSVTCFPIKDGIKIAGLTFRSICAFEDDPEIRAKRPDLLVRAPGTPPVEHVSFGTEEPKDALMQWYTAAIGPKHASRAFESADETLDGKTHVTCTAWFPH